MQLHEFSSGREYKYFPLSHCAPQAAQPLNMAFGISLRQPPLRHVFIHGHTQCGTESDAFVPCVLLGLLQDFVIKFQVDRCAFCPERTFEFPEKLASTERRGFGFAARSSPARHRSSPNDGAPESSSADGSVLGAGFWRRRTASAIADRLRFNSSSGAPELSSIARTL